VFNPKIKSIIKHIKNIVVEIKYLENKNYSSLQAKSIGIKYKKYNLDAIPMISINIFNFVSG